MTLSLRLGLEPTTYGFLSIYRIRSHTTWATTCHKRYKTYNIVIFLSVHIQIGFRMISELRILLQRTTDNPPFRKIVKLDLLLHWEDFKFSDYLNKIFIIWQACKYGRICFEFCKMVSRDVMRQTHLLKPFCKTPYVHFHA